MAVPDSQADVAGFLGGLAGRPPIETHISAVFVGKDTAFKLKKAVRLAFLDFSDVSARHRFLRRELELNQMDAPEIYRDLAAIERQPDGRLSLVPEADSRAAIDWVLRMAPIPAADFLDVVAARGGLTPVLLDALGDCVARSHQGRAPIRGWDSGAALLLVAEGCEATVCEAGLPPADVGRWQDTVQSVLQREAAWLAARAAAGFVRRCHADLHLGNLCLWHGQPVPFDALEFDEDLGTIDVGYDLAFLLMDLDRRVGRPAANRVLNRYIARTGDAGLSRGLPLFLSLRAMVRARVHAVGGDLDGAARCLATAFDELQPAGPVLLAIGGPPGSGKSTLARKVAPLLGRAPGAVVLRSDEIRKRQFGTAPEQHLPQAAYGPAANAAVAATLLADAEAVARGGQSVIADAMFLDPDLRRAIAQAAASAGVPFVGVWLTAPRGVLEARVGERVHDASDATLAVLRDVLAGNADAPDWLQVDATDAAAAAQRIAKAARRYAPVDLHQPAPA